MFVLVRTTTKIQSTKENEKLWKDCINVLWRPLETEKKTLNGAVNMTVDTKINIVKPRFCSSVPKNEL